MVSNLLVFLSTCIGDNSQPLQSNMSATKVAPQINRKQTRVKVDDQIQKSIKELVMRGMWLEKVLKSCLISP